jgi:hypothetical protein
MHHSILIDKNKLAITSGIKYWGFIGLSSASPAGNLFYRLIGKCSRTPQHFIPPSVIGYYKKSCRALIKWIEK